MKFKKNNINKQTKETIITILFLKFLTILLIGCSIIYDKSATIAYDNRATVASDEDFFIEDITELSRISLYKMVDKETNCKYLIVFSDSSHRTSVEQMLDRDGLPLCK